MEAGMAGAYDEKGQRKYLTTEESLRFMQAARLRPSRDRLLCQFLFFTGARVSEATRLRPIDLDTSTGEFVIRTLKQRKAEKFRRIPVPDFLPKDIQLLQPNPNAIIWNLSRSMVWRIVTEIMREAEIEGIQATCKGLRHTFAVRAILQGVPLTLLQKLMGHTKIESTAVYLDVMDAEQRKLVAPTWKGFLD